MQIRPGWIYRLTFLGAAALATASIAAASSAWTFLIGTDTATINPGAGSSAVYDADSNGMIVFGGVFGNNENGVSLLSRANGLGGTPQWTSLILNGAAGSPPARSGHSAVYDSINKRMIVFGGCGGGCLPALNDVWVLANADGTTGTPTWTQLSPFGTPPAPRVGHAAVYDPDTNSMIVFAGQNGGGVGGTYSDTWILSNANGLGGTPVWTQLSPIGGPPPGQYGSSAVYGPVNNIMMVFGGGIQGNQVASNAVWTLSHANGQGGTPVWKNIAPEGMPGAPAKRYFHTAVYDRGSNRMTIFGGNVLGTVFNNAWVLINANGLGGTPTWKLLGPPSPLPALRASHTAVYDAASNRMTIFGGSGPEGTFWSVWVLTDANGR
ncbi:MAG TPA: kelch repeat-containing protein [Bryobacteraceae bacterium]|nr:kelch repeat-containing protein [Bryobacteraceae bacterium]